MSSDMINSIEQLLSLAEMFDNAKQIAMDSEKVCALILVYCDGEFKAYGNGIEIPVAVWMAEKFKVDMMTRGLDDDADD